VRSPRPAGAQLSRRALRGVGRAVVLGRGEQLREEDEQNHLARRLRVWARPATRSEGDDEQGGELARHVTKAKTSGVEPRGFPHAVVGVWPGTS
jgi:hypothetical protein